MRLGRWYLLALGIAAAACASTIGPVVPSIQVLVVLDSLDDTLRIIPVDSPEVMHKVLIPNTTAAFGTRTMALSGNVAAISRGGTVRFANVVTGSLSCETAFALNPIVSLAFANGVVYAAIPASNAASFLAYPTCGVGNSLIRGGPRAFVSARTNQLFVVTGDSPDTPTSWLSTITNQGGSNPLSLQDSIPLSSPGHARGAVLASDGFLYVVNAGSGAIANARLSQVDPVQLIEQNVYNGFGTAPQYIATDGDRVFVASALEGLMVYNTHTKQVERNSASAIPLVGVPRGLVADDIGRVYALIAGACLPNGNPGTIRRFGSDLVPQAPVTVGRCPVAVGVTDIPSTLYNFKD